MTDETITPEARKAKLDELSGLLDKLRRVRKTQQITQYYPTEKQMEFHEVGNHFRQRLLMAGNQTGKTYSAGCEIVYHMTGEYPDWWPGYRFKRPVVGWAGGVTSISTRDNPQRILLGRKREWGTGVVPKDSLYGTPVMARGEPDAVDSFQVKHISGGVSTCLFKNYAMGREKWQGDTLDFCWFDEEPPMDIYMEGLTRLNRRKGLALITFTPLLGMTDVVTMFLEPDSDDKGAKQRKVVHMTLDDATFYTKKEREDIEAQYNKHVRRARALGLPMFGEGLIYPVADDTITCEPFTIPSYWRRICGLDFGIADHPTAAVFLAYDPDGDTVYMYDCFKDSGAGQLAHHARAIKKKGGDQVPVAWPHDGLKKIDPRSDLAMHEMYEGEGIMMLPFSARYNDETGGSQAREPIIETILDRMETGRFKVFRHLQDWFNEKNTYHRKATHDGNSKIVDYKDDLISATHYAMMMLRHARPLRRNELPQQTADFDPLSDW